MRNVQGFQSPTNKRQNNVIEINNKIKQVSNCFLATVFGRWNKVIYNTK